MRARCRSAAMSALTNLEASWNDVHAPVMRPSRSLRPRGVFQFPRSAARVCVLSDRLRDVRRVRALYRGSTVRVPHLGAPAARSGTDGVRTSRRATRRAQCGPDDFVEAKSAFRKWVGSLSCTDDVAAPRCNVPRATAGGCSAERGRAGCRGCRVRVPTSHCRSLSLSRNATARVLCRAQQGTRAVTLLTRQAHELTF